METLVIIFLITGTVSFSINIYMYVRSILIVIKAHKQADEWNSPEQRIIREEEAKKAYEEQIRVAMKVARDMQEGDDDNRP